MKVNEYLEVISVCSLVDSIRMWVREARFDNEVSYDEFYNLMIFANRRIVKLEGLSYEG